LRKGYCNRFFTKNDFDSQWIKKILPQKGGAILYPETNTQLSLALKISYHRQDYATIRELMSQLTQWHWMVEGRRIATNWTLWIS
jgi:hypothetical protein